MKVPVVFAWVLVALAAYRAQRVVTTDSWPPSRWFRRRLYRVAKRTGRVVEEEGSKREVGFWVEVYELATCPWCLGTWASVGVGVGSHLWVVDLLSGAVRNRAAFVALAIAAAAALVGQVGQRDDD